MAAITKRGKTYSVRISYTDPFGKRQQKNKGGFRTKREAEYWAAKNEVRKLDGDELFESDVTLVEYFTDWYNAKKKPDSRPTTIHWYENTIDLLTATFPNTKLRDMTPAVYQKFITDYGKNHVRKSVSKLNGQVRGAVHEAVKNDVIRKDFTDGVTISSEKESKSTELKYLNAGEMQSVLTACKSDLRLDHITKFMIITAIYTGCRYSEIAGLTWDCIDWRFKTITINKAWDYHYTNSLVDTKTYSSKRVIKVNDELLQVLKNLRTQQTDAFNRLKIANPQQLVFLNNRDQIPTNNAANKTLRAVLSDLDNIRPDILKLTFHGLRHTHASYLLYQGVSIYYISQRLGHKSFSVTLNVYSHIIKELETKEASKAIRAFDFKSKSTKAEPKVAQ